MKTLNHDRHVTHLRSLVLISAFIIAVAAMAVPFYSVRSKTLPVAGRSSASVPSKMPASASHRKGWASMLSLPTAGETIAIYAADCSTPKDAFSLGEVVCAKTDGVDLVTTPGNYYMNWVDSQLNSTNGGTITQNPQYFLFNAPTADTWKATIGRVSPPDSSIIGNPPLFTVSADQPGIGIFESTCTTPKSVFNLQDADPGKTVCAKVRGGTADQYILWSNAKSELVQSAPLGTGQSTFTLTAGSSLGDWRVILYEPNGGSVYAVSSFTVIDASNPSADISVSKGNLSNTVAAGSRTTFTVQVTNSGPDAAAVEITDSVPNNTTFFEFAATAAPSGTNCAKPAVGASSGNVVCTIPSLARGETATFLAQYDVISGTPANTVISNTATITSSTPADPNNANNSSTATVTVGGTPAETCTLDCPANKVVTADTTQGGQPGAFVTYGAASGAGNCGTVTNSPASGSFFIVGTHSVVSTSQFGSASCSFTVTVLDSNPPTITCPPDKTVQLSSGQTEATVNPGTPTVNASGGGTVTGVRSDDTPATYDENGNVVTPAVVHNVYTDPYQIGSTGILWTVTDAGGRTASCSQTITVVAAGDRPPVTISCPANVSAAAPQGSCEATISAATIGTPTTNPSDNVIVNCSDPETQGCVKSPVRSDGRPLSDPFPAGTTVITWTATDTTNGNVASCSQTVTVTISTNDTTPPTLHVPPNVNATTSSCTVTLDDELGVATAEDAGTCSGDGSVPVTRTGVPPNFVFYTGTTMITYTATDASGNTATGVQLVTVTESPAVPPMITAPPDVTANTGAGATSCGTTVSDLNLGTANASDNCPGVTVTRTGVPAGNFFPVGNTTVTYTATDRSGNTASAQQVVTVVDNTVPIITTTGLTPTLWPANHAYITFNVTNFVTAVSDNCGGIGIGNVVIQKVTSDETENGGGDGNTFNDIIIAADCKSVQVRAERRNSADGRVYTITFKVTDTHGNVGTKTATIDVPKNLGVSVVNSGPNYTVNGTCP